MKEDFQVLIMRGSELVLKDNCSSCGHPEVTSGANNDSITLKCPTCGTVYSDAVYCLTKSAEVAYYTATGYHFFDTGTVEYAMVHVNGKRYSFYHGFLVKTIDKNLTPVYLYKVRKAVKDGSLTQDPADMRVLTPTATVSPSPVHDKLHKLVITKDEQQ